MTKAIPYAEWKAEAERRFGTDAMAWKFVCPSCGHVACVDDWRKAKAPESAVAFSCVGRWTGAGDDATFKRAGGPCQYAGGGLFGLNPVAVRFGEKDVHVFDFVEIAQ